MMPCGTRVLLTPAGRPPHLQHAASHRIPAPQRPTPTCSTPLSSHRSTSEVGPSLEHVCSAAQRTGGTGHTYMRPSLCSQRMSVGRRKPQEIVVATSLKDHQELSTRYAAHRSAPGDCPCNVQSAVVQLWHVRLGVPAGGLQCRTLCEGVGVVAADEVRQRAPQAHRPERAPQVARERSVQRPGRICRAVPAAVIRAKQRH